MALRTVDPNARAQWDRIREWGGRNRTEFQRPWVVEGELSDIFKEIARIVPAQDVLETAAEHMVARRRAVLDARALVTGRDGVSLSAINDSIPEGRQILGSARVILRQVGKAEAGVITVADAAAATQSFANTVFNGDGVILPESADDTAVQQVVREAMVAVGSVMDRSGKPGIDA
jgi:hypothetical protein